MMPHRFVDLSNLDMEKVNDNLEAGARDVGRNLAKRYTYSSTIFDVTGITEASAAALCTFAIRRPGTNNAAEIVGVELILYTATAVTWTLTCSDPTWPALLLLTTASATTESYAARKASVAIPSSSADVTFALTASGASTITSGYLVVHMKCDRGDQGTSHAGYVPTLVDSSSSTAGSLLDTQLTALATAVGHDTTNDVDLRCECFVVRDLLTTQTRTFRVQSGVRRVHQLTVYAVAAVGTDLTVTVGGTGIVGLAATPTSAGATVRAVATDTPTSSAIVDDPMDSSDDSTIAMANGGAGTVVLGVALLWFS
jgi:hypothetical protein